MIRVQGVSKRFRIYATPADRLKEKIFRQVYHHEHVALSDISFEVMPGETLGIIGENGAGKSTLLKILSGVLLPDSGTVEISGKVTGLLELGTGFNPELSGVENIFMNGTFLGMTHAEIEAKKDTIIKFAELGDFINEPIKTYSSGMIVRLGFSIAIHADPECFLVDEALSVGDAYFQQKCMRKIQEFKEQGGSIIFVSHDMNAVKVLCDRAYMLESGSIGAAGSPKEVVDYYNSIIIRKSNIGDNSEIKIKRVNRDGAIHSDLKSGAVDLINIRVLSEKGEEIQSLQSEETLIIEFNLQTRVILEDPHFGFMIRNRLGQEIFQVSTYCMGWKTESISANSKIKGRFIMNCPLHPGDYFITLGVADKGYGTGNYEKSLLFIHDLTRFQVIRNENASHYSGIFNMHPTFQLIE